LGYSGEREFDVEFQWFHDRSQRWQDLKLGSGNDAEANPVWH